MKYLTFRRHNEAPVGKKIIIVVNFTQRLLLVINSILLNYLFMSCTIDMLVMHADTFTFVWYWDLVTKIFNE